MLDAAQLPASVDAFIEQHLAAFPVDADLIVKPNALDASIGIHLVHGRSAAAITVRNVLNSIKALEPTLLSIGAQPNAQVLVEEAIPRDLRDSRSGEYTFHFVSRGGLHDCLGISAKALHPTSFLKTAQVFPARDFPDDLFSHAVQAISILAQHLGVLNAISNWDVIVTPDRRIALLEGHLRPAGDGLMELIERSTDVSPYASLLRYFASEERSAIQNAKRVAARFHLFPSMPVAGIEGFRIAALPDGLEMQIDARHLTKSKTWSGPISHDDKYVTLEALRSDLGELRAVCDRAARSTFVRGFDAKGRQVTIPLELPY
jgi:hypothetical protein